MDVSLDSVVLDELNTPEARAVHDITDKLSACGVGKIVDLPQIIVLGEQSAGKSSVLEAISHVRFPVKGGLCTRFATELVLRQAETSRVDVSIRYEDKTRTSKTFKRTGFNEDDLPDIIAEAKGYMGVDGSGREFSKDVLRLEIDGPKMYPLKLVDLPGLFHVNTADQSMKGKEVVDELVESYLKQENSIILAVIVANREVATQVALAKIQQHDPKRERTIGVVTKPDLTSRGLIEEKTYIKVIKNKESAHKLKLGWHVLRNRAEDEHSLATRDTNEEAFFEHTAWGCIPSEDRGVTSLRKKLSRALYDHIRKNLPSVIQDIEANLNERLEELDRLGPARSSEQEKRAFLFRIAGEFQRLARDGVRGHYSDKFFGGLNDEDNKLRAQLRSFNRVLDYVLRTKGATQLILREGKSAEDTPSAPEHLQAFLDKYPYDFPVPESISTDVLNSQLQRQAASNQGGEFPGCPSEDLVTQLFQKQASPWSAIADYHMKQVTFACKAFVDRVLRHVVGSKDTDQVMEAIFRSLVDPFFEEKEKILQAKLEELLRPYLQGSALPLDADFLLELSHISAKRLAALIVGGLDNPGSVVFGANKPPTLPFDTVLATITKNMDVRGGEFGTDKVIDMMETFYEVSLPQHYCMLHRRCMSLTSVSTYLVQMTRRTFTDNVINLAQESCLICDIPEILTPIKINSLNAEELNDLAAETESAALRRERLEKESVVLKKGLEQCRRYRPRGIPGNAPFNLFVCG